MKAFRLRGDKESLKSKVCEHFSGAAVCTAKKIALGFLCRGS